MTSLSILTHVLTQVCYSFENNWLNLSLQNQNFPGKFKLRFNHNGLRVVKRGTWARAREGQTQIYKATISCETALQISRKILQDRRLNGVLLIRLHFCSQHIQGRLTVQDFQLCLLSYFHLRTSGIHFYFSWSLNYIKRLSGVQNLTSEVLFLL